MWKKNCRSDGSRQRLRGVVARGGGGNGWEDLIFEGERKESRGGGGYEIVVHSAV